MKYSIGLDIGIASVGYAVLALDHEENPWGIIRLGSRIRKSQGRCLLSLATS